MTILLDTINLPDDLVIDNEFSQTPVRSSVAQAVGGGNSIWEDAGNIHRNLDLTGTDTASWLTRQQHIDLFALASSPGASYTLDYNGTIYIVRFRNEEQPPIEAVPVKPMASSDYEVVDYYNNVRIKLMILG